MIDTFKKIEVWKWLDSFSQSERALSKSKDIVKYFYFLLIFLSLTQTNLFTSSVFNEMVLSGSSFNPTWPVFWIDFFSLPFAASAIRIFFITSAILGAFYYQHRWARILVFVGLLEFHAFESSFISFVPHWYFWVYTSFVFIFLPNIWREKINFEKIKNFLAVFWSAQVFILFSYTLSGFGKLFTGLLQFLNGEGSIFMVESASYQISNWLLRNETTSLWGEFLIQHSFLSYIILLLSIYLQTFSIWIAFRPRLHKLWAIGLIIFHVGTFFVFNIIWLPAMIILPLLFFDSPFLPKHFSWRKLFGDLPLFGFLFLKTFPQKEL